MDEQFQAISSAPAPAFPFPVDAYDPGTPGPAAPLPDVGATDPAAAGQLFANLYDAPAQVSQPDRQALPATVIGPAGEAALELSNGYNTGAAANRIDPNQQIPDMANMSPDEKMKVLHSFTQNDPNNGNSGNFCGPTALIAAAMYSKGTGGVQDIIGSLKENKTVENKLQQEELQKLEERLKDPDGGGVTMGDLKSLEGSLYSRLVRDQEKVGGTSEVTRGGIGEKTLANFINQKGLNQMFFDEQGRQTMSIANIDNGPGMQGPGHFVLNINDQASGEAAQRNAHDGTEWNAVFDPYSRKNGQMTTGADAQTMQAYMTTEMSRVDIQNPN